MEKIIVEKKLGISPDYQYKALRSKNFVQSNWHNNKLVVLDSVLKFTHAKRVLDLGTGSGNFELKFAKKLKHITGVDYNNEALTFLKKQLNQNNISNVKLVYSDIRNISEKNITGKFDLIISVDVIEHIRLSEGNILIKKLKKFLKPDGYICLITPNYKSSWPAIEKMFDLFHLSPHMDNEQHVAKFNNGNINKFIKKNGYNLIYLKSFNFFFFIPVNKYISSIICKLELTLKLPFGNLIVCLFQN